MSSGFEPVFSESSRILILGSFPSVKSREVNFYYGNKQNRFWKMLSEIYAESLPLTTQEKKSLILNHELALWDICQEAEIKGSSDSDIRASEIQPVNLHYLLKRAAIEKIICNGKKSYELLNHFFKDLAVTAKCLPSTSPANTKFDIEAWRAELMNV